MEEYKIKEGLEISTSDFWYDLTMGGYVDPKEILENKEDIEEVLKAIEIIRKFEISCENQIECFCM